MSPVVYAGTGTCRVLFGSTRPAHGEKLSQDARRRKRRRRERNERKNEVELAEEEKKSRETPSSAWKSTWILRSSGDSSHGRLFLLLGPLPLYRQRHSREATEPFVKHLHQRRRFFFLVLVSNEERTRRALSAFSPFCCQHEWRRKKSRSCCLPSIDKRKDAG